jgi:hypothetical protein
LSAHPRGLPGTQRVVLDSWPVVEARP